MTSDHMPAVLCDPKGVQSSISVERALRQIKDLLESFAVGNEPPQDRLEASIGDVEFMISRVQRW